MAASPDVMTVGCGIAESEPRLLSSRARKEGAVFEREGRAGGGGNAPVAIMR